MAWLIVTVGDDLPQRVRLEPRKRVYAGSDPRCSVRLPESAAPPFACEFFFERGTWYVRDLTRRRAVAICGEPVAAAALADGDSIEVGGAHMILSVRGGRAGAGKVRRSRHCAASAGHSRSLLGRRKRASQAPYTVLAIGIAIVLSLPLLFVIAGRRDAEPGTTAKGPEPRPPAPPELHSPRNMPRTPPVEMAQEGSLPELERTQGREVPALRPEAAETSATVPPAEATRGEPEGHNEIAALLDASDRSGRAASPSAEVPGVLSGRDGDSLEEARLERAEPPGGEREGGSGRPAEAKRLREAFAAACAFGELEAARRILDTQPADTAGTTSAALRKLLGELESARQEIEKGIDEAIASRRTIDMPREARLVRVDGSVAIESPPPARGKVRLLAREGGVVTVGTRTGKDPMRVLLLSLPPETLSALAAAADARFAPGGEAAGSLAAFLALAAGPTRAAAIVPGEAPPVLRLALALAGPPSRYLERKLGAVERVMRGGAAGVETVSGCSACSNPAIAAAHVYAGVLGLRNAALDRGLTSKARALYVEARSASLPLRALFHAIQVDAPVEDAARLRYDFTDKGGALEAARDWRPVGEDSVRPSFQRGRILVSGEYRLLDGNPFRGWLRVSGSAMPLEPSAPNVNIALWTDEGDRVTCTDGAETRWFTLLRRDPGEPADYFVFGMGYRTVTYTMFGRPVEQVLLVSNRETADLPAFVVLGGARGRPLHKDLGEGLFAERIELPPGRPVRFTIEWLEDGTVRWEAAGRKIDLSADGIRKRFRLRSSRKGSVTFFTNGRKVALERLEIEGGLDPAWVERKREEYAAREFAALLQPAERES